MNTVPNTSLTPKFNIPELLAPVAMPASEASGTPASLSPQPYEPNDLHGLSKVKLADLVLKQIHLWKDSKGRKVTMTLIKYDTNKDKLIAGLIMDSTRGFTMRKPRKAHHSNLKQPTNSIVQLSDPNSTPNSVLTLNSPTSPATGSVPPLPVTPTHEVSSKPAHQAVTLTPRPTDKASHSLRS
ncbi:hypothetical protein PQX77_010881 [Marasmius sp. AFHP31]|nr:hypothetical protein PQX77_010881 [Marasmius sp. AFHP31]